MEAKQSIKSFGYVLFSNIISFLISGLITFIVPKRVGVESYSYFQLYLFYNNYIGFLHFGWADGVFLRYGGEYYDKLDKKIFSGQIKLYMALELICGMFVSVLGWLIASPQERKFVLILTGISIFFTLSNTLHQYILQCTNRVQEYSVIVILEKCVYVGLVVLLLLFNVETFIPICCAELTGKAVALVYGVFQCRALWGAKPASLAKTLFEAKINISVGVKLLFANLASLLIIGIVRVAIENQWDVVTFGKVSLTISVSNMLMVLIRAVALVMFPMLRRTDESKYTQIYNTMRTCLMIPLLGMLIFYYPIRVVLSAWLPEYADSLKYMALLFPMCIFESKMSMLIETYMKTMRKEKWLMWVNVATVTISVLFTGITVYLLHNLDLAIVSIVILLAFRCILAELLLATAIQIQIKKDIVMELVLTLTFILASWCIGGWTGIVIYVAAYLLYLVVKRKDIAELLNMLHTFFKIKCSNINNQ